MRFMATGGFPLVAVCGEYVPTTGSPREPVKSSLKILANREMTYVCSCYGETLLSVQGASDRSETIHSRHHDAPRYI